MDKERNRFEISNGYITVTKESRYKFITCFDKDDWSIYYGAIKNSGLTEHLLLLNIPYDNINGTSKECCALCLTDIEDNRNLTHFWKVFERTRKRVEG